MKARIKWIENRIFMGESGTGHSIVLGSGGGAAAGSIAPSPMELVLIGLGGCSAYDVVHILEKGREPVEDCVVELEADRAETEPKVFTHVRMRYRVTGRGLDRAKVERAVQLSADKYCSASAMIAKTAEITHEVEVVDSGTAKS
ncbi:OsmC family protein [Rhodospirillaceae bacterium SYSU D60014]|uniref:OsmC family protein n=1 Tax=Virgifigura deserti TaxID=2268457 RepID=UPI000E66A3EB